MPKKEVKSKEQLLETVLWNCRVALRTIGSLEKKRDAIISLCFLNFASVKFERRRREIIEQYGDVPVFLEKVSFYNAENVYYLDEHCRWSYIVKNASADDIAVKIDKALADIEAKNPPLKGALPQQLFVSLNADKSAMKALIDEVNKINEERFKEEDLIGMVYEYFLQNYAASGTKEDDEFYTPACVVELITELIEPFDGVVYDPCCGSGGMFVQSMRFVDEHKGNRKKVSVVGQESNPDTWRLAKMNLSIRGISCDLGEKNASTFTEDLHKDRKVRYIMANPPFKLKKWRGEDELIGDPRFKGWGAMPPVSNANYAWILHMLSKMDESSGIAGFLLANGALNAGAGGDDEGSENSEYLIRKQLLERDKVEAIIVLPRDMFYTTDISVTLWILNNNKKAHELNGRMLRDRTKEVLFVDLRRWDDNTEEYVLDKNKKKKKTVLSRKQIEKIRDLYFAWQSADRSLYKDVPEYCKAVTLEGENGIKANNYTLTPSKYVEFIDHDLDIDFPKEMARIQNEMKEVIEQEKQSQQLLIKAFEGIGYGIE